MSRGVFIHRGCSNDSVRLKKGITKFWKRTPHRTRMCASINLERMREAVPVKHIVQFGRVDAEPILIADVDGNAVVLAQIPDVLIEEASVVRWLPTAPTHPAEPACR